VEPVSNYTEYASRFDLVERMQFAFVTKELNYLLNQIHDGTITVSELRFYMSFVSEFIRGIKEEDAAWMKEWL